MPNNNTLTSQAGRPRADAAGKRPRDLSAAEVALRLDVDEWLVRARLRAGSFFPGAWEDEDGWHVPEKAVEHCLRCSLQPVYSLRSAAQILDLSYGHVHKLTHEVAALDEPLPPGKGLRAVLLFLGGAGLKRIPESELRRVMPHWRAAR
jgi:hypothetical protein